MNEYPVNAAHLSLFIEEPNGLVFHHVTRELHYLNAAATFVLLAIDDGLSEQEILTFLNQQSHSEPEATHKLISDVTQLFDTNVIATQYADSRYPELEYKPDVSSLGFVIDVANVRFSISCSNKQLLGEIESLVAPISVDTNNIHVSIQVEEKEAGFNIVANRVLVQQVSTYQEVMPELIDRIQVLAYQHQDYLMCFHGAGVKTAQGLILIPGQSGAGKSTLCATLCAEGAQLFSDEMLVLDKQFQLKPIPLPMAVKTGSWSVLSGAYPQLKDQTAWKRLDGRQLKYIWPLNIASGPEPVESSLILCPQFQEQLEQQEKRVLSVVETMKIMTQSGYQIGVELDINVLKSWLLYLQNARRLTLSYDKHQQLSSLVLSAWQSTQN